MKMKRWGETLNTGVKPRASDLLCKLSAMAAPYRALRTNEAYVLRTGSVARCVPWRVR